MDRLLEEANRDMERIKTKMNRCVKEAKKDPYEVNGRYNAFLL